MKVYVSATFRDLEECRAAVRLALRRLRVEDTSMESYVAEDRRPLERCLADVADCDVYVGIFAWRYGIVPPGQDRSITELEYRQALATGKPCLIFLLDEEAPWPRSFIDRGRDAERIERLRAELSDRHMCSTFHDPADLATMVTAALANVQLDIGQPAQVLGTFGADVIGRYFHRLRQHYGLLDLDPLTPPQDDDHLRIQLASVFVEQWVREDPPPVELPREWLRRMQSEGRIGTEDLPEEVDPGELVHLHDSYRAKPLQRLFDVLGAPDQRTIVLLGDPGSGKSSAVRHLALSLTTDPLDPRMSALADHLPLLIELRSYLTLTAEGRCDNFVDYLDYRAGMDGLGVARPVLLRHLRTGGRVLMILDGLDEVFDRHQRERVAGQIAAFATDHPRVRMIVTSRIVGYSRRILTEAGFTHYTLQDLDEKQIAEFLSSWYGRATATRPTEVSTRQDRLLETMRHSSALRELAGNPLLLTTLAIVGRHQPLPRERWKLYDHAATVLVEQWDVNRHLRERSQIAGFLDTEDKKELLRRLAWRMQSADRGLTVNYIDRADLGDVFERYLIERYDHQPDTARVIAMAMIDQFRERNFILSRYGPHVYGFVHRSFLEFFCAEAILTRFRHNQGLSLDRLRELFRRHAADLSWREVLRLVTSAMTGRHAAALVEVLVDGVQPYRPAGVPESPPWNLVLAVQCLAEIRRFDDSVATAAENLLRKVILLLEQGVGVTDPGAEQLFEEEILPAARLIGSNWPRREIYLDWYRRRGVRLLWSPTITHATRLAVILSTRADGIEELIDRVLAEIDDSRCAHAVVAGLVELAANPTGAADTARLRHQLVRRARDDGNASVRLAALQALAERHGTDPEVRALLLDRSRADPSATVRAAGVQTLRDRFRGDPAARRVLLDRLRHDDNTGVRRTAVQALSETSEPDDELRQVLAECVLNGRDIEVLRIAVQALTERFAAGAEVIDLLTRRAGRDEDGAMRAAAVRLLGEQRAESAEVEQILIGRLREDSNPGVLRSAAQVLLEHFDTAAESVCAELVGRARDDVVKGVRRTAAQLLVEHFGTDPTVRAVLVAISGRDPDPENRAAATKALAGWASSHQPSAQALLTLVTVDRDSGVRLAALEGLVEAGEAVAAESVLVDVARSDGDANVRAAAVRALALRCADDPRLRRILVERLREDPHGTVRTAAVQAVGPHLAGNAEVQDGVLYAAQHDPSPTVFGNAVTALIDHGSTAAAARRLLLQRARTDANAGIRLSALRLVVSRFQFNDAIREVLMDHLRREPDVEIFSTALAALAAHSAASETQRELLTARATNDPDSAIREAAVVALAERFGTEQSVRDALIERAQDVTEVRVRRAALRVLGEGLAGYPEVRALVVDCLRARDWSLRELAVQILAQRYGTEPETRALLSQYALSDPDPDFRRLAAQVLSQLPGTDPEDLPDLSTDSGAEAVGSAPADPGDDGRDAGLVHELGDVFTLNGTPTLTFVEPPAFRHFLAALRQPGLGIVLEGPSGIGKSTFLQQAVRREKRHGRTIQVLTPKRPEHLDRIRELPTKPHRGIVAIDDFQQLSPTDRTLIANLLKLLADEGAEDRRLVIAGIPGTGDSLVEVRYDLATRIQVFKIPSVDDELVTQMIRQGEAALNVSFGQAEQIVTLATGSLNTAQMLCWHLAHLNSIERTQTMPFTIDRGLDEALAYVETTLALKYKAIVHAFACLDGERQQSCIELLLMLPEAGGVLDLDQVATEHPHLATAIDVHLLAAFPDGFGASLGRLEDTLYLNPHSRQLIIEDPQFLLYLRRQSRDGLARTAGKRLSTRRRQIFVSYSHQDTEWLQRLRIHLQPLVRDGHIELWTDTQIEPGSPWREEITAAIDRACAAILLVSADFLASTFITEVELPALLEAARADGCRIMPLIVAPSQFQNRPEISKFQAFNDPKQPLSGEKPHDRETVLAELAATLLRLIPSAAGATVDRG